MCFSLFWLTNASWCITQVWRTKCEVLHILQGHIIHANPCQSHYWTELLLEIYPSFSVTSYLDSSLRIMLPSAILLHCARQACQMHVGGRLWRMAKGLAARGFTSSCRHLVVHWDSLAAVGDSWSGGDVRPWPQIINAAHLSPLIPFCPSTM